MTDTKSKFLEQIDSDNIDKPKPFLSGGSILSSVGVVEIKVGEKAGHIYRLARIPSSARLHSLQVQFSGLHYSPEGFSLGLYCPTAKNSGCAVRKELFASALLGTPGVQEIVGYGGKGLFGIEQRLWEMLELKKDPFLEYDICLTTEGDITSENSNIVCLKVLWVL